MNRLLRILLFVIFFIAATSGSGAQDNYIRFEHISSRQGLSNSAVHALLQDKKGFMWFGTQGGLYRFDGYKFVEYKHDPNDPLSLPAIKVLALYEDSHNELWIGTDGGGLCRFNRARETFIRYRYRNAQDPAPGREVEIIAEIYEDDRGDLWLGSWGGLLRFNPKTEKWHRYSYQMGDDWNINSNRVQAICQDRDGIIWVGTYGGGLNAFNPDKSFFTHYLHNPKDENSLSSNIVNAIIQDNIGNLWIATSEGLDRYNSRYRHFDHYKHQPDNPRSLSLNQVKTLYQDSQGVLWVGTYGGGLNQLKSLDSNTFTRHSNKANNPYSLSHNTITSITEDQSGSIWIGTFGGGVNRIDRLKQQFRHFYGNPDNTSSISNNDVSSFCQDKDGNLWIGTNSSGLNKYDPTTGTYTQFKNEQGLSSDEVVTIYKDSFDELWIGTWGGGINRFNTDTGKFVSYLRDESSAKGPSSDNIYCIYEDQDHNLWFGTGDGGLNCFHREKQLFSSYQHNPNKPRGLSSNSVTFIHQDLQNPTELWLGTYNSGLERFDRREETFDHFSHEAGNINSLSHNSIRSIYISPNSPHIVWVGTFDGGLNRFDKTSGVWKSYKEKQGLPNNTVYGILEDKKGYLWLSTHKGLSRFNPKDESFSNYDADDGLQGDEFNQGAFFKSRDGRFYFGGINGYNVFLPEKIKRNTYVPPVVITAFKVRNEEKELDKSILETDEIHLSYKDYIISFEFAALNYTAASKNQYQYKMVGLDEDWIPHAYKRDATFTRLAPGRYTFRVRGSNNDGVWNNEGTSIDVVIHPPFWGTWWFQLMTMLLFGGVVVVAYKLRVRSYKMQRKLLAEEVEVRTHEIRHQKEIIEEKNEQLEVSNRDLRKSEENLMELNATKDKFFSIISHDMRNHLTTLIGTSDLLANNFEMLSDEKKQKQSTAIHKSAMQLHELLENLLQWARSQTGGLKCKFQKLDVESIVKHIVSTLTLNAKKKKIQLEYEMPEELEAYADKNMVTTVLRNLVSNAIKFTERGGWIQVTVEEQEENILVSVIDNGIGISREKQASLFKIGMNHSTKGTANEKGTGLGLILCKEFVEQNNGTIWYEGADDAGVSETGSIFRFTLPKTAESVAETEDSDE